MSKKSRFPIWDSLPRFIPSQKDKVKWIWGRYLPQRAITLLYGRSGTAKSPFVKALSAAISRGDSFLNENTRRRRVLYIDMENPPAAIDQQNRYMGLGIGENPRLIFWSCYGDTPDPNLHSEPNELLEKAAREYHSQTKGLSMLIVLDHWQQFLSESASGLEPGEVKPLIKNLKRLVKAGATILIIGHPTGNDKKMYGFGSGDIDVRIHWTEEKPDIYKMKIERSRLAKMVGHEITVTPIKETKANHDPIHRGFRIAKSAIVEIMRQVIAANPTLSQDELATKGTDALKSAGITRGRIKVINEVLKPYDGKEWLSHKRAHNATTYTLIGTDVPVRFPRS